jgi:hypothetical protein
MRPQRGLYLLVFSLLGLLLNAPAAAQTYTTIDFPGACGTIATAINSAGSVVGDFGFSCKVPETVHGYIFSQGTFAQFDFPGSPFTRPLGINDAGDIVGYYHQNSKQGKDLGFLLSGGSFITIEFPGATETHAIGIDSASNIYGGYCVGGNGCYVPAKTVHGFALSGGVFTTIDFQGATFTEVWGMDSAGQIAGRYEDTSGLFHAFLLSNGGFTSLDYPGAAETAPGWYAMTGAINPNGHIVNTYCAAEPCANISSETHGFLLIGDVFTAIDVPGAVATLAVGVNSSDWVVGPYLDASGQFHGFLRMP